MISNRLKELTKYVEKHDRLVDVGCDHGLLSIYLYINKLCELIIASDKNQNALNNAIINIKKYNLEDKIETFLSDGIENIDLKEYKINTLIIAGMGTKTILKILENPQVNNINKLIIQSNREYSELRKNITKLGFYIEDESIILDNKKYYLTILFKRGNKKYSNFDYRFGIVKKSNKNYYEFLLDKYKTIYKKIPYKKLVMKIKTKIIINELFSIIKNL